MDKAYYLGLDLGQTRDFTALAVLQQSRHPHPNNPDQVVHHYAIRYMKRWPLQTPYPSIVASVAELVRTPPLDNPTVAIDQTGVGRAVVDMFRKAGLSAWLRPILITGGHQVNLDSGVWHVPKKELVSVLQVLLQTGRLKIGPVPERELLVQELLNFRVKITTAANETFEAWRERDHDDLVLSVALAAWMAERNASVGGITLVECKSDKRYERYLGARR
jgi:hypothetical protein